MTARPLHAAANQTVEPDDVNARRQRVFVMVNVNVTSQNVSIVELRRLRKSLTMIMQQLPLKEVCNYNNNIILFILR